MPSEPAPILAPRENVNDETVRIVSWIVADGERVDLGQSLVQIETSKAVLEIEATVAGLLRHLAREGEEISIGGLIGHIEPERGAAASNGLHPSPAAAVSAPGPALSDDRADRAVPGEASMPRSGPRPARFSRRARECLEQQGLDPAAFEGRGLVRSRDLAAAADRSGVPATAAARATSVAARSEPVAARGVAYRTQELPRSKRTEANYLRSAHGNTLLSSVTVSCPTRGLRAAAGEGSRSAASPTAIIAFEAARLLRKYPAFNAFYADGDAHHYEDVNVGFALDAGRGLKVPVIRHADRKGMVEIVAEMRELMIAYLEDRLPIDALAGGTFTVTDLSGEGVSAFHPLINQGQSAILGICTEVFPPGSPEGTFNLVLSFDHQVSEGRTAARFLGDLRERLAAYESVMRPGEDAVAAQPRCARCYTTAAELEELDAGGHFLIQTVGSDGAVRPICTICLSGH